MKTLPKLFLLLVLLMTVSTSALNAQIANGLIKANPSSLSFVTNVNQSVTDRVEISVLNLSGLTGLLAPLIDITIEGSNANQYSTPANNISLVNLVNSVASGIPLEVEVTYNPTSAGSHSASLVFKAKGGVLGVSLTLLTVPLQGIAQ